MILASLILINPPLASGSFDKASAEAYLLSKPSSPWTTMALAALGAGNISSTHLADITGTSANDFSAPILAIAALGQNPRTFGSQDYAAALKNFYTSGQIGDTALLNDDVFGMLALISAGENPNDAVISSTKSFLLAHQNSDGGWGFAAASGSDTNITAAAILALLSAGLPKTDSAIQNAVSYLQNSQNDDGGLPYDSHSTFSTASDAASTSWVLWALNALNINPASWNKSGKNPITYLEANQTAQGYFSYQPGAAEDSFSPVTTAYAVIALSGKTLPLQKISLGPLPEFGFRIEGSADQVCAGQAPGPTALDIVKNASIICGFTYNIQNTSFGPYLNQLDSDAAQGLDGWLYLVNYLSPSVGAADYLLQTGDQVLWYYGSYLWLPTRLTLENSTVTVEQFQNGSFSPLAGATVYFGASSAATAANGQAAILPNPGFYKIHAEKTGYIRSNAELLQIGDPESGTVNLAVNVNPGQAGGVTTPPPAQTVSFTITPSSLNFGDLNSGQSINKNIAVSNQGNTDLQIETVVSGDDLFRQNLKIDSATWGKFKTTVTPGENKNHDIGITVPSFYSGSGQKNGVLTFWAIAN